MPVESDLARHGLRHLTLILGGARSGKSALAESMAERHEGNLLYIATADPAHSEQDEEMKARIAAHRARRGLRWRTIEEGLDLAGVFQRSLKKGEVVLIDCLTLWLTNLMDRGFDLRAETEKLAAALGDAVTPIILISNEVGLGIVPENALARAFRDEAGKLNQRIAAIADRVFFVAAGLPLQLK